MISLKLRKNGKRSGYTMMELIVAMAISGVVLTAGYQIYYSTLKFQDVECERESMMLNVQNAMARIKSDVRNASSVQAKDGALIISGPDGEIVYKSAAGNGVVRLTGNRHRSYKDVTASFSKAGSLKGVNVDLKAGARVHRRPIRVEISSYVSPRN